MGEMVVSWMFDHHSVVAVWLREEKAHEIHTGEPHHWTQRYGGLSDKEVCLRSSLGGCPVEANQWDLNAMFHGKHCALNAQV